jgi:hypothetical protein
MTGVNVNRAFPAPVQGSGVVFHISTGQNMGKTWEFGNADISLLAQCKAVPCVGLFLILDPMAQVPFNPDNFLVLTPPGTMQRH